MGLLYLQGGLRKGLTQEGWDLKEEGDPAMPSAVWEQPTQRQGGVPRWGAVDAEDGGGSAEPLGFCKPLLRGLAWCAL